MRAKGIARQNVRKTAVEGVRVVAPQKRSQPRRRDDDHGGDQQSPTQTSPEGRVEVFLARV